MNVRMITGNSMKELLVSCVWLYAYSCEQFSQCDQFIITSYRRAAAKICLRPLQVNTIFVFIRQVAPVPAC